MKNDWDKPYEDDGVTLGPEDALHREIEKTKALKVEKIQLKDHAPTIQIAVKTSQTLLVTCFRRLRGIVHQRIEALR